MKDIKKILIKGMILTAVLTYGYLDLNYCMAADNTYTVTYEQLTRKYPSMEQYATNVRRKIKNNWYPPTDTFENEATILLNINKNGELVDVKVLASSQNERFDESLIQAAKKAKYSPLPADVNEDNINIDLLFKMERRHLNTKK